MRLQSRYLFIAMCFVASLANAARQPFELAGNSVPAGEQRSFLASVTNTEMVIPMTVFHGSKEGPVLTLSAGTHGDEFPAITALQRLRPEIDLAALKGTLILVHAANLPALHQYGLSALHPSDKKNLNREFPGSENGTATEQLAHFLTQEIVERSDYLADLHSGSAYQQLWPHIYAPFVGDEKLDARTLAWAKASGMRHIVLYGDRPRDPENSISYPNTAMTRGKPGLTLEIGDLGNNQEKDILAYLDALHRLIAGIDMLPSGLPASEGQVIYKQLVDVETPSMGFFEPHCEIGELVEAGALLGVVRDYFGESVAELRAPKRGVVLMLRHTPPVNKGMGLITLGIE
ncbi:MAG: succinylglutamate desuccinylase/aspartoacylase family protein [Paraglaciecola chathamensis]|jgi:predicted deacylase|uniref:Succinylglutamate desuccinylase/aspartoacylase n=1 Tax=Paraglaciecola agarilytica NO2 TaxID=1125747 RepID=A0ABQ0IE90_9ALTE|nr:succinylglutamate desuccinylase/aspartoacylase family protein [Paraglaciecola agarilytica]AEE21160.1 Succinylglutamate desuccinylase/aspartoacylase [Glaciecola sp. 4H-3-7+YE-5]GAC07731.1 succinylglutamate desuccinylase/aspartoacylase [Paraglaciecola agarilytica NO2]